jgi:hypothetical protein
MIPKPGEHWGVNNSIIKINYYMPDDEYAVKDIIKDIKGFYINNCNFDKEFKKGFVYFEYIIDSVTGYTSNEAIYYMNYNYFITIFTLLSQEEYNKALNEETIKYIIE